MRILAADTSTKSAGVALLENGQLTAEWIFHSPVTHNRRLLGTIDFILQETQWSINSVDGFAVTAGPGSFTGVRIGLSTVKTLAWALGKLYAGIPTLDALAAPLGFSSTPLCAVLDARKKEVYYAIYQPDGRGGMVRKSSYRVATPDDMIEQIKVPTCFCGDGWLLYRDLLLSRLGSLAFEAPCPFHTINAGFVAQMAHKRFLAGEADDPMTSAPIYVRPSEAELKNPQLSGNSGTR